MPRRETALLCQRAENQFVGVNSGIMDQYASLLCVEGAALLIDCRSLEAEEVPLDLERAGLVLLVCYTGTQRTLASSGYNERRAECERAAAELGVSSLRDATLADLEKLHGVELRRARHIVTENARVLEAVDALHEGDFAHVGRLMIASHESLRDDYEVSTPQLDAFVDTATQHGALGARLTGAGFGGCAIALVAGDAAGGITDAVTERFAREGFGTPTFYRFHPSRGADVLSGPAEQAAS
jgi:galactokinase